MGEVHNDNYIDFLVNVFPTLVHVPDWLPWTGWKKTAREWREHKNHAIAAPYEWTKRKVVCNSYLGQPLI
jgi:hypothetical protein